MSSVSTISAEAWSDYWSKGFFTTFVDAEQENYSGEIKTHWNRAFTQVPDQGTIVDIGAGNGAILALAKEALSEQKRCAKMIAIDFANISSTSDFYNDNPAIDVRGNTDIADTGLPANSIDLCTSQFGFEYADTPSATNELIRILKPGGKFEAIMHHRSSEVTLHCQSALEQVTLCNRSKLAETTEKLLRRLQKLKKTHRSATQDSKAAALRDRFNSMAARLNDYADRLYSADHVTYFLNQLGDLFASQTKEQTFEEKLQTIKQLEIDSAQYNQRMLSMLDASSDQVKIDALVKLFTAKGLEVLSIEELAQKQKKFAWVISAIKSDGQ